MKSRKKCLVMVLSSMVNDGPSPMNGGPDVFKRLYEESIDSWAKSPNENTGVYFYFGQTTPQHWLNKPDNVILCSMPEGLSYPTLIGKTIEAFQYALDNYDFDYIFRPCAGSYIDTDVLSSFLDCLPKEKLYGPQGFVSGINYVSGSAIVLSRDLVENLVVNEAKIDRNLIDDMAFGQYIVQQLGINIHEVPGHKQVFELYESTLTQQEFAEVIQKRDYYHYHIRKRWEFMDFIHKAIMEINNVGVRTN
jgi:hypothetical protein